MAIEPHGERRSTESQRERALLDADPIFRSSRTVIKNVLMAALGFSIGGAFLWLALRKVDIAEVRSVARDLDSAIMVSAGLLYWIAVTLRSLRWQILLKEISPAPFVSVMETLIVGYAVNNVLPARLGEVVRAAYAKRRLRIGRARVFGSIVVERILDLGAILGCLVVGLLMFRVIDEAGRLPTFELIALNAGAVIGVALLGVFAFRSGNLGIVKLPKPALIVFEDFRRGLATLNRNSALLAVVLTITVWCFETAAVAQSFRAFGAHLDVSHALLLMGAASLSTLVPTAPGYLGTYQLVFVIAMTTFGFSSSVGIVSSTAIQIVLFGSVTVAGVLILGVRSVRHLLSASAAELPRT